MKYCGISNCEYENGLPSKEVLIFRMPLKGDDRQKWIDAIEKNQTFDQEHESNHFYVCELHFRSVDINRQKTRGKLRKGIAPSIFPNQEKCSQYVSSSEEIEGSGGTFSQQDIENGTTEEEYSVTIDELRKENLLLKVNMSNLNSKIYNLERKLEIKNKAHQEMMLRVQTLKKANQKYEKQKKADEHQHDECGTPAEKIAAQKVDLIHKNIHTLVWNDCIYTVKRES